MAIHLWADLAFQTIFTPHKKGIGYPLAAPTERVGITISIFLSNIVFSIKHRVSLKKDIHS
jgi:hypothetical protein